MTFDRTKLNIACSESLEIIMHMEKPLREKISSKMIDFLKENKQENYKTKIDFSKNILEQDILFETKSIISIIYRDYIAGSEKRKELIEKDK